MLGSGSNRTYVEEIEFLPDDFILDVSKFWFSQAINYLHTREEYSDLLHSANFISKQNDSDNALTYRPSSYVKVPVHIVKRLIAIYGSETLFYMLPYNYNAISEQFVLEKLEDRKGQIEKLVYDNQMEEAFLLIDVMENSPLKRLSWLYMKYIYNKKTELIIEDVKASRKRTIEKINRCIN